MSYQLFTDATADLTAGMLAGLPEVHIIPMQITLDNRAFTYGPGGDITVEQFYAAQRAGKFASTSQINPSVYLQAFEKCLREGNDVLYLCFSSGMSGTYQTARLCAEELEETYPARRVLCLDTRCASVGEGFLVREAARKQAEGLSLTQLAAWVEAHKFAVCHWFTVDTFDHLKHGGRVSATAAVVGTLMQIKPLLHVTGAGTLEMVEKPRGTKRAMGAQLAHMQKGWTPAAGKLVIVGHGDCSVRAEQLAIRVQEKFSGAQVHIAPIGPVIGAHTGPGMLALIFWGTER